jgi:23S rRNA (cytidine1920-2'-O)/16S rRNA (cytidine1409-2'-O)-methyltransferase
MNKKERIDVLLVDQGFFDSREKAKRSIMAGLVYVGNERIIKPGEKVDISLEIRVKGKINPYVSRGGFKLEKAIKTFALDLNDTIMVDIGSSTGGFTDCALQNGAKLVYAVDVGTNQLDWKIRSHEQVMVMEKTNFRYATLDLFTKGQPEFASIDVSFISLKLILPALHGILVNEGEVVALIKPQFEAGKELVGKNGIVRDASVHQKVIQELCEFAIKTGYSVLDLTYSPIKGSEGNIEFLVLLKKGDQPMMSPNVQIESIVKEAHDL